MVEPKGQVRIADNSKLCQCSADKFVEKLEQNGWTGTPDTQGDTGTACRPGPVICH